MFNFVEIYRFVINPLRISQNFILISFFVKKLLQKTLGRARVNNIKNARFLTMILDWICLKKADNENITWIENMVSACSMKEREREAGDPDVDFKCIKVQWTYFT